MKKRDLSDAVNSLLNQKLPQKEAEKLIEEGYKVKSPTRRNAIAVALFKKASNGDLSATKEIINLLADAGGDTKGTVTIIDDTKCKDI